MNEENMYRFIPMSMDVFDIEDLKNERDASEKLVMWHNGTEDGKQAQDFKVGDVVYIYSGDLSDQSRRLIFRAVVAKVDGPNDYSYDPVLKRKAFWIKKIQAIRLTDKDTYSKENLIIKYGMSINQTMQKLATNEEFDSYCKKTAITTNNKKHLELIKAIENDVKDPKLHSSLNEANTYFNENVLCECCNILGFNKKEAHNRTFRKSSGYVYYEIHHLLMQNILQKKSDDWLEKHSWYNKEKDYEMIKNKFNEVLLCPVCHREFHYGDFNYRGMNKKQVIDKLLVDKNYRANLKKYGKSEKEIEEIIQYIYEQYGLEYK